ncbi:tRNA (guanosine(46)-N7)-methyltransferase TrmB [Stratiformator vulcanicus]|uniref:tRNA (guanine-N(7)-)-methyltransferase n=1 Tax=Stratiformator vulcanicus TaxID=2527980 RepID=A0A517R5V5_9PLAN|nr:tRNA (guanosine(46)-N7)-methyltransferase TrmB [Stratiformator vulcanicus]QDT39286.1 tRNA (guanine-N(7)-)-methyltransferase [Stratiformator vulcanicus]
MQQQPPGEVLRPWFVTLEDVEPQLDWATYFEREQPVELDIGCGRGLFLVNASDAEPETNFLGMEVDFKEARRTAKRLKKRRQPNARVIGGDAKYVMKRLIDPHSVSAAHVYFPDPWWKQKQRHRRLFDDVFVDLLDRVVKPGGLVHSWTDVPEYFEVISGLMNHDDRFEQLPPPDERPPEHELDYQTSFERKAREKGVPIHRGLWRH